MKLIFLGTSVFALPALKALHTCGNIELALVISRPDSRSGRGRKIARPPVAVLADELGIRLLQPEKLKEIRDVLAEISPDVMVSASYGGWLPEWFLGIAPRGVVNIHPSLLPRHRGAAPVIRTILEGDEATGVCFMVTDEGWDTGDILCTVSQRITGTETAGELEKAMSKVAAAALPGVLADYAAGILKPVPQTGTESYAEKITPEEAVIPWLNSAEEVRRMILAFNPVPGARTMNCSKILKIYSAEISMLHGSPGEILETIPLVVGCGTGSVRLLEVQPQGKRRMSAEEFVRGYRVEKGVVLGES
ncbi:MAG: methionyl-tRNA formyltransferase [Candidatus Sabulitectum sp.]|nr:methionyl-tRNA formyltransferase [Candidatus Sabulitectum sp.]